MLRPFALAVAALAASAMVSPTAFAQQTPEKSKFEQLTTGLKHEEGLWSMYSNDQKLLVHLKNSDLGKNFVVITSIAKGISSGQVLGGMSWGFGDEVIWNFRKVGDNVHILRKNVRFKAKAGSPEANAVRMAYSDSVLYSFPILTSTGSGILLDLTRVFMSDDEQIGKEIGNGSFRFAADRSTWSKVKAFPSNVELEVNAVYAGAGDLDTVADTRGVQVAVHYSISELPMGNGYQPREADDRVGYFLTATKDFSNNDDDQHFVRYINRWDLRKEDSSLDVSPPKKQIIFYLEKTVPIRLRPIVREGIEEWNKAFEKVGFSKAIEVRQQLDSDDWDPEDVRYNTFRWITAEANFAMGPSRVNPLTGEILDADIIFDAGFLRAWKTEYENFSPPAVNALMLGADLEDDASLLFPRPEGTASKGVRSSKAACSYGHGMQQQMGFAAAALAMQDLTSAKGELPEQFIRQGLKEVVMHEVGHTLGLRHNFKASSWKSLADIDDPVKGAAEGTVASVMDYVPANIASPGGKQGLYFPPTIGPYDYWAIEYGYKPFASNEKAELAKIAARGAEKGLAFATDGDTRGSIDSDPLVNRFDLGSNPLEFVARQMKTASDLLPKVLDRAVKDGDGYQRARQAFGMLFSEYWRSAFFASRFPGGVHVNRDHKADPNGRPPFEVVDPAQQRAAMKLLGELVFASPKYDPKTLNYLASTRWDHWGVTGARRFDRVDYPIHDNVLLMQERILGQLLSPTVALRLRDNEVKVAGDVEPYTLAEHLRTLVDQIFGDWKNPNAKGEYTHKAPYIDSFRRNLQRSTLKRIAAMVTVNGSLSNYPEDARTLARMHLQELQNAITTLTTKEGLKLDDYTRAHLLDSQARIKQVLDRQLNSTSIE